MKLTFALALAVGLLGAGEVKELDSQTIETYQSQYQTMAQEPGGVMFTPPANWKLADPKVLTPHIKLMVIGEISGYYPPSINLASDPFKGTLKEYLKGVKQYNQSIGADWKDLGTLKTEAGEASLSQVDTPTKWGVERQMQAIFLKDSTAWIVTCSALKADFAKCYKIFFGAMKSLRINPEKD